MPDNYHIHMHTSSGPVQNPCQNQNKNIYHNNPTGFLFKIFVFFIVSRDFSGLPHGKRCWFGWRWSCLGSSLQNEWYFTRIFLSPLLFLFNTFSLIWLIIVLFQHYDAHVLIKTVLCETPECFRIPLNCSKISKGFFEHTIIGKGKICLWQIPCLPYN